MADKILPHTIRQTLFDTTASRYDSLIMPALGPLAKQLVEIAAPQPDDHILDLGTATSAVSLPVAQMSGQVIGMDFAPAMLPLARQNAIEMQAQNLAMAVISDSGSDK